MLSLKIMKKEQFIILTLDNYVCLYLKNYILITTTINFLAHFKNGSCGSSSCNCYYNKHQYSKSSSTTAKAVQQLQKQFNWLYGTAHSFLRRPDFRVFNEQIRNSLSQYHRCLTPEKVTILNYISKWALSYFLELTAASKADFTTALRSLGTRYASQNQLELYKLKLQERKLISEGNTGRLFDCLSKLHSVH